MPLPVLAGALVSAGTLAGGVYNVGRALEEKRYWDNYYRSTHRRARWPFRSGSYNYLQYASNGIRSIGFSTFRW